jgi:P2-related tail formation protein
VIKREAFKPVIPPAIAPLMKSLTTTFPFMQIDVPTEAMMDAIME